MQHSIYKEVPPPRPGGPEQDEALRKIKLRTRFERAVSPIPLLPQSLRGKLVALFMKIADRDKNIGHTPENAPQRHL